MGIFPMPKTRGPSQPLRLSLPPFLNSAVSTAYLGPPLVGNFMLKAVENGHFRAAKKFLQKNE